MDVRIINEYLTSRRYSFHLDCLENIAFGAETMAASLPKQRIASQRVDAYGRRRSGSL